MREFSHEEYLKSLGKTIDISGKKYKIEIPKIKRLEPTPEEFELQTTTVYSFQKRGDWATHYLNASYRGNFAPEIARNVILRYSKLGELVLDPFCGSGTTLIEAKLLKRNFIGTDVNPNAVLLSRNRLDFGDQKLGKTFIGDARKLDQLSGASVDLIIAHPPYANIIEYSGRSDDLSSLTPPRFFQEMAIVSKECYRVLKPGHFCAILVGDGRSHGDVVPIAYQTMQRFIEAGFKIREDIIKVQWNCSATPFWKNRSKEFNFHLIMHEHLFVFRKDA